MKMGVETGQKNETKGVGSLFPLLILPPAGWQWRNEVRIGWHWLCQCGLRETLRLPFMAPTKAVPSPMRPVTLASLDIRQ